jgi:hypothetical protein
MKAMISPLDTSPSKGTNYGSQTTRNAANEQNTCGKTTSELRANNEHE